VTVDLLSFPAGEAHKTRAEWALLSDGMFAGGVGRDAAVLALGGGVTGDLAGFVAATYMRGIPLVQLPTTLLAMIDSSVGGKTGVDTPAGKNLVGAFLQPAVVAADTATLHTLPAAEIRAGLAEAIKHGAIADAAYFEAIAADLPALAALEPAALQRLIVRSVEIKAEVVGRDEKESGPRKMLNFGHTLGHAVEALSGYRLLHGEAVAIGMVLEARLGEAMGVTEVGTADRITEVLSAAGLPTRLPERMSAAAVLAATRTDKKARRGRVEYALIERIGAASAGGDGTWGWAGEEAVVEGVLSFEG
jgi:3-dehydroquinate synthase